MAVANAKAVVAESVILEVGKENENEKAND
jgi:hypothetical protein